MHYSGVRDDHARKNPGWAAINVDGQPDNDPHSQPNSLFGHYAEKLLIPQLCELALDYQVDGAWVDGDCWAVVPDYSEPALKEFRATTGIQAVPRKPGDPHWFEFLEFQREAFRKYLRHDIAEVKKVDPEFQYCSNWAFTDHMPEPVSVPVDFLSGDFDPENSVNSARFAARYLVRQGKPWDLMAWSFAAKPDRKQKPAAQLEREAAVVIALGGGFQAYFKQKRDGSIYDEQMPVMAEVAKFCRARQELCHYSEPVPQVALLLSTAGHYHKINGVFSRDNVEANGVLQALLESQQSVEVVGEHQLAGRLADYPLIIIPEWEHLEPQFKADLVTYAKAGGNLLLIGPKTAELFQTELGVTMLDAVKPAGPVRIVADNEFTLEKSVSQLVRLDDQSISFGTLGSTAENPLAQPAASIKPFGKGKIAATYFSLGRAYRDHPDESLRKFLNELTRKLFPEPMVEVTGSHDVDVCVARNHGKLLVNLINTSGPHRTQSIIESIASVGPLTVSIRQQKKPTKVTLEPAVRSLPFEFTEGKIQVTVPSVAIHEAIVITP